MTGRRALPGGEVYDTLAGFFAAPDWERPADEQTTGCQKTLRGA